MRANKIPGAVSLTTLLATLGVPNCRDFQESGAWGPTGARAALGAGEGGMNDSAVGGEGGVDDRMPGEGGADDRMAGGEGGINDSVTANAGGGSTGESGTGGAGGEEFGASGDSGRGGDSGGNRGIGGDDAAGGTGDHDGGDGAGDGGEAGAASKPSEPGIHGAVRLLINGDPVCGGTLITNSWVLTADRCVPTEAEPASLTVGFGMNATNFHQVRRAIEIQRFPGNTPQTRVRDLVLIGVDAPFELNGSTTNHFIPVWPFTDWLVPRYRCAGWDLEPDPNSPTDQLVVSTVNAIALTSGGDVAGVWWVNSDLFDPLHGILLTPSDIGVGCFYQSSESSYLVTVHTDNPPLRRDGQPNEHQEAYSTMVGAREVQDWLDRVLFAVLPETDLNLAGVAGVCSPGGESIDLFARMPDGQIGWFRRTEITPGTRAPELPWVDQPAIPPLEQGVLASDRPGVFCGRDGTIELFARGEDGLLWRQRWLPGTAAWRPDWELVTDARTRVTSGISVVGLAPDRFHVYARGELNELRHAEYRNGWTGLWENLGDPLLGAPSARMGNLDWADVFVRSPGDELWNRFSWGTRAGWALIGTTTSEPAVTSWAPERIDLFARTAMSRLTRTWYDEYWSPQPTDTGITLPAGELTAVSRGRGSLDVFVSGPELPLWHAIWPRSPAP